MADEASAYESTSAPGRAAGLTDAQRALRAQILATEHWSLLASRSTTQSEVLVRIALYFTLVSAGLLSLGLIGQATGFRGWFGAAALGILVMLTLIGLITQLRAYNTAVEDLAHVLAMNRLRGAYLDLDPGLEPNFLMSADDDEPGARRSYYPFADRSVTPVFASSMMVITVVCGAVFGLSAGAVVTAFGGTAPAAVIVGVVAALVWVAASLANGFRLYRGAFAMHRPLRTTGAPPAEG